MGCDGDSSTDVIFGNTCSAIFDDIAMASWTAHPNTRGERGSLYYQRHLVLKAESM